MQRLHREPPSEYTSAENYSLILMYAIAKALNMDMTSAIITNGS